jgi:hypothetical protein
MWYMRDLGRLTSEQAALADLEARQAWFTVVSIYFDDQVRLCFDTEIEIGPKRFPIRLTYPQTFPYTPRRFFLNRPNAGRSTNGDAANFASNGGRTIGRPTSQAPRWWKVLTGYCTVKRRTTLMRIRSCRRATSKA